MSDSGCSSGILRLRRKISLLFGEQSLKTVCFDASFLALTLSQNALLSLGLASFAFWRSVNLTRKERYLSNANPGNTLALHNMEHGISNPEREAESVYPKGLQTIVNLFESLPDQEKRDALISYADQARKWEPRVGETFDLEDVRKDAECTDTVGVFLKVGEEDRGIFRVTLGSQVQTLTRAMTSILCRGLEHSTVTEVLEVPSDFVPKIVGGDLIRARSQTVYYVLTRMKGICKVYLDRRRAATALQPSSILR